MLWTPKQTCHTGETSFDCACSSRAEDAKTFLVSYDPTRHSIPKTLHSVSRGMEMSDVARQFGT